MEIVELTEQTWPELVGLFGPNGAQAGCWCTWFLQSPAAMRANGSDGNRELLRNRVRAGVPTGLLARTDGGRTVGRTTGRTVGRLAGSRSRRGRPCRGSPRAG